MKEILFSFGVITDIQFAECNDSWNFAKTEFRRYRHSVDCVKMAIKQWNTEDLLFICQLGDIIDGVNKKMKSSTKALLSILEIFDSCSVKNIYHCIGNHELYNFTREQLISFKKFYRCDERDFLDQKSLADFTSNSFYSFNPVKGWKVIVLDSFYFSVIEPEIKEKNFIRSVEFQERKAKIINQAYSLLEKYNGNNLQNNSDWTEGLEGLNKRYVPFNGALGQTQREWLKFQLYRSQMNKQKVIMFSHVPLYPASDTSNSLIWDYEDVRDIFQEHSSSGNNIVAVFSGHSHRESYVQDNHGIHHVSFPSPLTVPLGSTAFASVDVCSDYLNIRGYGVVNSYRLFF